MIGHRGKRLCALLLALGLDERQANESIRFSLSDDNTEAEVDAAIALLRELLA